MLTKAKHIRRGGWGFLCFLRWLAFTANSEITVKAGGFNVLANYCTSRHRALRGWFADIQRNNSETRRGCGSDIRNFYNQKTGVQFVTLITLMRGLAAC